MGNEESQPTNVMDDAARARRQQLQELQDISSNYLDNLEFLIDSRNTMSDPRDVLMILKSNLKTARQAIGKISSQSIINITTQQQQQHITIHNDSPLPNGEKKTNSFDSPQSKSHSLQLQPTDSNSTVGSSFLSKYPPLNNRFAYDWSNASIEQIYFDQCNLGKINSIQIATSTYDPVIMATVSQDGKCRIWKLRQKSKYYSILKTDRLTHQVQLFEADKDLHTLHSSHSDELKEDDYMAIANIINRDKGNLKRNSNKKMKNKNKNKKDKDKDKDKGKGKGKGSLDSYSNDKIDKIDKIARKELRFELCHEIKLSSTWNMCVAIHHAGNMIAIGGLDTNVTLFDITSINNPSTSTSTSTSVSTSASTPDVLDAFPNIVTSPKYKKQKSKKQLSVQVEFEVCDKDLLCGELSYWSEYISCIEFMNDDVHMIVGSGDGSVTICNYVSFEQIYSWRCVDDVISVDYLYLQPQLQDMKHLTKSVGNNNSKSKSTPVSPRHKKKKKKWRFTSSNKKNKHNDSDTSECSNYGSDLMSNNALHYEYNNEKVKRNSNINTIMVLIGTCTSRHSENNIFIDEYNLSTSVKQKQKHQEQEKIVESNGKNMRFSFCLNNKKCESVKFSPNGKYFAVGGEAGKYEIYNRDSMQLIHERYTKDEQDIAIRQRRPNLLKSKSNLKAISDTNDENDDEEEEDDDGAAVTCMTWINDYSIAVGNVQGEFIYISTILNEYKIRSFVLKEWINILDKHFDICNDDVSLMNVDNIIEEIHDFVGCDVIDNVIETNFGERTSCLTSHPYFQMRPIHNNHNNHNNASPISYISNQNKKEGLCVSASWSKVFQGCVLKG